MKLTITMKNNKNLIVTKVTNSAIKIEIGIPSNLGLVFINSSS